MAFHEFKKGESTREVILRRKGKEPPISGEEKKKQILRIKRYSLKYKNK